MHAVPGARTIAVQTAKEHDPADGRELASAWQGHSTIYGNYFAMLHTLIKLIECFQAVSM